MFRAHVHIVRRTKLYYTASGIVTPIGGRPMHRLREEYARLFQASTCFGHHMLIVRRAKLYYTVSGIITPIGGRSVHRTATYRYDDTRD
jgi:hypothetical protein